MKKILAASVLSADFSVLGKEVLEAVDAGAEYVHIDVMDGRFVPDADFATMKEMAEPVISQGCHTGDGWLVAAEVADLVEKGYENILIVHPFGCLVSHVCERGIMKKLHERYPGVNIHTIEYDYDSAPALRERNWLTSYRLESWRGPVSWP